MASPSPEVERSAKSKEFERRVTPPNHADPGTKHSDGMVSDASIPSAEPEISIEEGEIDDDDEAVEASKVTIQERQASSEIAQNDGTTDAPPLPEEEIPPLPDEAPPAADPVDDGWAPLWDDQAQAFYFYNRFTSLTQWDNPRVPETTTEPSGPPGVTAPAAPLPREPPPASRPAGGYDPSIHGDYDPNAWYAQPAEPEPAAAAPANPADLYGATGQFNRFTGRWQAADLTPDMHNDEAKSKRQMSAFFDVDAAANSHDGRSLKAERSGKKLTKTELKQFKEKRKAKKEEKRRAWLRD